MLSRLVLVLGLIGSSLACSNEKREPAPGATPPTAAQLSAMPEDQVVDAALKSMAEIARLAKQYAADCEALAKALADHAAKNKDVIAAFKKLSADPAKQQEIATRHGGRILAIGQDTVKSLEANCATHPAVRKLFDTLNN